MAKAIWNGAVLARADNSECKTIEGNTYFPPEAINQEYFQNSDKHTTCVWKGVASYLDVVVDGNMNSDAAWYYAAPRPAAKEIKNYIAFWHGVQVQKEG